MRAALRTWLVLSVLAVLGCRPSQPAAATASERGEASAGASAAPAALPPPAVPKVARDEPARQFVPRPVVEEILEAGMGRLLQRVRVEPARREGRFVGYRVVDLDPAWEGGPVRPGDVVIRLNGMTLQTPAAAQRALDTLAVASEVVLEVVRDGEPTRTRLAIH